MRAETSSGGRPEAERTRCRRNRLWINRPAPISSTVASASSPAARRLRSSGRAPPSRCAAALFQTVVEVGCAPSATPARGRTARPSQSSRATRTAAPCRRGRCRESAACWRAAPRHHSHAPAAPSTPHAAADHRQHQALVSNCRNRRPRLAPIAVRTAISFAARAARASSRFAMLAHAISSTNSDGGQQHQQRRRKLRATNLS